VTKKLEKAKSWGRKLKKKHRHYKSKAARFFKQLSFLPWLRDQSWARGFDWAFESFQVLVLNPKAFRFQTETMIAVGFMDLPELATIELIEMGADLFPDASGWGQRASSLDVTPRLLQKGISENFDFHVTLRPHQSYKLPSKCIFL
jgi:hypothetical protein